MSNIALVSNQRKLVASDDLDQQIATLSSLINNPPQNSRTVEIGPKLAEYILANINIGNRPKKVKKIAVYSNDMANSNWSLTGDAIKFGTDGHLKDGQNRLAACVRAGVPFVTDARFGIDPKSFVHMDVGATRTNSDIFAIMSVPYPNDTGQVIRLIRAFEQGKPYSRHLNLTNDQMREIYTDEMDHTVLELGIKMARQATKTTGISVAPMAALFYVAWKRGHSEQVKQFLIDLKNGYGTGVRSPVRYLLETIVRIKMENRNKIHPDVACILLARAWHNYKVGKASVKKDMQVTTASVMPTI